MDSDDSKQGTADMTAFVQNLLQQMFLNFFALDEMGSRINELEQSINELKTEMGGEGSQSPLASTKEKPEDSE
ncbi:hypothetical protein QQ045_007529 [Rhodiola kirilowii]